LGYDIHLTRKNFWADDDGPEISLEEWTKHVASDPDLQPDPENKGPENAVCSFGGRTWPLWWNPRGEIVTKNPTPPDFAKLVQLASAIGAHVMGDDGEIYGLNPTNPAEGREI
jgi:hypothetical protein